MRWGRASAIVLASLVAACSTPDKSSSPAPVEQAAEARQQEAAATAAPEARLEEPAAAPPPTPAIEEAKPAEKKKQDDDVDEGAAPKASPGETGSGKGGSGRGRRVFAAVVKGLQGSLTEEQVAKTVGEAKDALHACFANDEARLEVSLQIAGSGEVGDASIIRSSPPHPQKSECAGARLAKLRFPPPGQSMKLELAIYLEPKG
jgi:hypothetical protein